MATAVTLGATDKFPSGTTVSAYKAANWPGLRDGTPSGTPLGSADTTAVTSATDGTTAFTGLTTLTKYFAYASVSAQDRYLAFSSFDPLPPYGSASGDLTGTYPAPTIANGVITNAYVNAAAAIAESKLNLATDAAAGTGSRRTLGTSATSAAAGNDSRFTAIASTTQADSYTLALVDAGTAVGLTKATANTVTVPPNSSVAFPVGTWVELLQYGAGQVTIAPGAGVTLRSDGAKLKTTAQYAVVRLRQRAADEWVVSGDLTT